MKKSLITLFLITSVLAFSEINVKKVPYESMIKSDDGIIFVEGDSAPYTGIIEKKSEDGRVESTISIKDGKLEGIERNYFPNGKLKSEMSYKEWEIRWCIKSFLWRSVLLAEAYFTEDQPNGVSKEFYPNGKLKSEQNFSMGAFKWTCKIFLWKWKNIYYFKL